jgi:hypothetical protein
MEHHGVDFSTGTKQAPLLGTSQEEIKQRFAGIVEMNFRTGDVPLLVSSLSDRELKDIATLYAGSAPESDHLLRIIIQRVDDQGLARISNAFGPSVVAPLLVQYNRATPMQRLGTMLAAPTVPAAGASEITLDGPGPTLDMTLQEIYLEYRTAPVGSVGPAAALAETTMYSGGWLAAAWGAGYAFGTGIHDLIEMYDPALDDVIGGTIQQAVDDINVAADEFSEGYYESAADSLFGGAVGDTGNYAGDWNVGDSYDYYEDESEGGC